MSTSASPVRMNGLRDTQRVTSLVSRNDAFMLVNDAFVRTNDALVRTNASFVRTKKPVACCRLQVAGCRLQVAGCNERLRDRFRLPTPARSVREVFNQLRCEDPGIL
jgi:hypothetical protein